MCLKFMGLTICLGLAFVKSRMRFNLKKEWQASDVQRKIMEQMGIIDSVGGNLFDAV